MAYVLDLIHNKNVTEEADYFKYAPFSRFQDWNSPLEQFNLPFSFSLLTFRPNDDVPLLYTVLAPGFACHSANTQAEIEQLKLAFVMHQHNTFELIYVIEGELLQPIEHATHKYPAGSCCLLCPSVFHTEDYSHDCRLATLSFSPRFLTNLLVEKNNFYFDIETAPSKNELIDFIKRHLEDEVFEEKNYMDFIPQKDAAWSVKNVHRIFDSLTQQVLSPQPGSSFFVQALVYQLFNLLGNPEYFDTTPVTLGTPAETKLFMAIAERMKETHGRVTRNDLIQEFNYSGTYINNVVKKFTGMNIFHYGNTFTMQEAATLLTTTSLSISEIALSLSFSNRAHFYRLFFECFGMTPKEYREKKRTTTV